MIALWLFIFIFIPILIGLYSLSPVLGVVVTIFVILVGLNSIDNSIKEHRRMEEMARLARVEQWKRDHPIG